MYSCCQLIYCVIGLFLSFLLGNDKDSSPANFKGIYQEMKVLDLSLFDEGDDLTQSRVRKVLELLGVKSLYPAHIIKHHILPQFKMVRDRVVGKCKTLRVAVCNSLQGITCNSCNR